MVPSLPFGRFPSDKATSLPGSLARLQSPYTITSTPIMCFLTVAPPGLCFYPAEAPQADTPPALL